jgi:hypothetical protein
MRIWLFVGLAAAVAAPARADLTATYDFGSGKQPVKMTVEVAANGDLRGGMNMPGMYMIRHDGRSYFVIDQPGGPMVVDAAEAGSVMQEEMNKAEPGLCEKMGRDAPSPALVSRGTVTVAGRSGEAFGVAARTDARPDVVISRDPALAPLGAAMAAQFRLSMTMMGPCMGASGMFAQMQALLDSGTAIQMGPMRLDTVVSGPVDPARFVLPAAPATREQVRAMMTRPKGPVKIVPAPAD